MEEVCILFRLLFGNKLLESKVLKVRAQDFSLVQIFAKD